MRLHASNGGGTGLIPGQLTKIPRAKKKKKLSKKIRDFPGGPVAKTPCSQCRGPRFDPWSGN